MPIRLRRLSEFVSPEERAPFLPALARLAALRDDDDPRLGDYFAPDVPLYVARAPGRLDVMGGIADYSGALVLQLPLARSTFAIVQRQDAPRCDIASRRAGVWDFFSIDLRLVVGGALRERASLAKWFSAAAGRDRWAAYVVGAVQHVLQRTLDSSSGVRLLIESDVPEGKGVSSSAALEVSTMTAVAAAHGVDIAADQIAAACQRVENEVVGAPCGIMDQMTSACGRRDRLLRLRCQPGTIEGYLDVPSGYRLYGIDSGVRHAVTGTDYGTVRTAAFMGYRIIADVVGLTVARDNERVLIDDPRWHGYLANVPLGEFSERFAPLLPEKITGAEFLARYEGITDAATGVDRARVYPVRRSTAHPIHEQARVERFVDLLAALSSNNDAAMELGELMFASHDSYGAVGLGSTGTDGLVERVRSAGPSHGVFGAKITGGGSGGTVAVLGTVGAEPVVREIASRYGDETGLSADVFVESGPGADETGVLLVERGAHE
jgi:galactokinase